jgi:methyl coenzyme M reductase subunit D
VVKGTVFEDYNGALELATAPKIRPRTKHIAIKYHHFRNKVDSGKIQIKCVDTKNQIANIFTKALPRVDFERIRVMLLGW